MRELYNSLEVDIAAMNEDIINLGHRSNINGFQKMFQGREAELRTISGHNSHENVVRTQEGGTTLLTYGTLIDYHDTSDKDPSGLGR